MLLFSVTLCLSSFHYAYHFLCNICIYILSLASKDGVFLWIYNIIYWRWYYFNVSFDRRHCHCLQSVCNKNMVFIFTTNLGIKTKKNNTSATTKKRPSKKIEFSHIKSAHKIHLNEKLNITSTHIIQWNYILASNLCMCSLFNANTKFSVIFHLISLFYFYSVAFCVPLILLLFIVLQSMHMCSSVLVCIFGKREYRLSYLT